VLRDVIQKIGDAKLWRLALKAKLETLVDNVKPAGTDIILPKVFTDGDRATAR